MARDLFADLPDERTPAQPAQDLFADLPQDDAPARQAPAQDAFADIPEEDEDSSLGTFFRELAGPTLLGGVRDAVQGVLDLPEDFGLTDELPDLPEVPEPTTMGGRMGRDVVQFLTGFVPVFGWLGKASKLGTIARGAAAGAVADFAVFQGQEERLSNLIQEHPALANPVTEFLAADEEDPAVVGRLKNTMEGAALGGIADGLLAGLRSLKAARAARQAVAEGADPGEAAKAIKEGKPAPRGPAAASEPPPAGATPSQQAPPGGAVPAGEPSQAAAPATELTPEDLLRPVEPEFQTRAAGRTAPEPTREVRVAGNINLDRIEANEDIKSALDAISREQGGFAEARAAGAVAGEAETDAVRELMSASVSRLMETTRAATNGSDADLTTWMAQMEQHLGIQSFAAGDAAKASARLRAFGKMRDVAAQADFKAIRETIESMGGRDLLEKKHALLASLDDMEAFAKAAPKIWEPKRIDKVLEAWRASLLTGIRTHEVNFGSNGLVLGYTVPERLLGASFGALSGGERIQFREAAAFASGAMKAMRKAAGDAWQVLWREGPGEEGVPAAVRRNVPGLRIGEELPRGAFKSQDVGRRHAIGGNLGYWIRTPFRGLDAGDVWFKTLNFWGEAEALAMRKALDDGLDGTALRSRVVEILADLDSHPDIIARAQDRAEVNTFTKALREQEGFIADAGDSLAKFTAKNPAFGFVVPFIRTPANIFKFAGERTPAAFMMKDVRKALKTGGVARQEALAKITLGSAVMGTFAWYASMGQITGHGPTNPAQRRLWLIDHQPYSAKIGGTWQSYARFEPLGTLVGLAADMSDIMQRAGTEDREALAMMAATAAANVMTNKTFMQGPASLIKALEDPERFGDRFIEGLAASTVPTLISDVARAVDPTLRDARGVVDAWMNRVPGASGQIEPLLNFWAEKIEREGGPAQQILNPIYMKTDRDDPVTDEFLKTGYSPGMPRRDINGHDLTPEQYTEYVRLANGKGMGGNVTLHGVLRNVVESPGWQQMPESMKRDAFESVIGEFRRAARDMMQGKHPELSVPADIAEQFGVEVVPAQPEAQGRPQASAPTPEQAEMLAAHDGLGPLLGRRRKPGPLPQPETLERRIDAAGRGLVAAERIEPPARPTDVPTDAAQRLVADPSRAVSEMFAQADSTAERSPEAFTAQVQAAQRAAAHLVQAAPRSAGPIAAGAEEPEVPEHERERWERTVAAVADPLAVIEDVGRGRLDPVALDTLRAVYPAVHGRLQAGIADAVASAASPPPYDRRLELAEVLGPAVEPSLDPQFVAALQGTFAAQAPPPGLQQRQEQRLTRSQQRRKSRNISQSMAESMGGGESLSTPIQEVAETV